MCRALFLASGCLAGPLLLPKVVLLPTEPFRMGGQIVPPLQKGPLPWMCHFDVVERRRRLSDRAALLQVRWLRPFRVV